MHGDVVLRFRLCGGYGNRPRKSPAAAICIETMACLSGAFERSHWSSASRVVVACPSAISGRANPSSHPASVGTSAPSSRCSNWARPHAGHRAVAGGVIHRLCGASWPEAPASPRRWRSRLGSVTRARRLAALPRGQALPRAHPPEVQIGLLDPKDLQVAEVETARKLLEATLPSNALMEA